MSMLVCPLCGKTSLGRFDPSGFDVDIVVQTVRGLGRGRGFRIVSKESVLGDDTVTPLVADRVLDIMSMLLRDGSLEAEEVLSKLRIEAKEQKDEGETVGAGPVKVENEEDRLKEETEASLVEQDELENQEQKQLEDICEEVRGFVDLIEETLALSNEEWIWEVDKEEEPLRALRERLTDLIDDYESLATSSIGPGNK